MELELGKLEEVTIRGLWKHEQFEFSEWLSCEENLEELNEALGLTLTDIQKEVYVGPYRADIVAKDETSKIKVVIENQLEATDHDHLGKIITYASGLDADVVVWIVKEAREEHRSAIEWLNLKTIEDVSFFLLEIHAYRIGDSLPAPKFEVIEKPNDFSKATKGAGVGTELNQTQAERHEFWTKLNEVLTERGKPFNTRKASTDHWYDVAMGTSDAHLSISLLNNQGGIVIEVYINDSKEMFDRLYESSTQIEQELGFSLDWQRLDDKKASRIKYFIPGLNFADHSNYPQLIDEVIDKIIRMRDVFKSHL